MISKSQCVQRVTYLHGKSNLLHSYARRALERLRHLKEIRRRLAEKLSHLIRTTYQQKSKASQQHRTLSQYKAWLSVCRKEIKAQQRELRTGYDAERRYDRRLLRLRRKLERRGLIKIFLRKYSIDKKKILKEYKLGIAKNIKHRKLKSKSQVAPKKAEDLSKNLNRLDIFLKTGGQRKQKRNINLGDSLMLMTMLNKEKPRFGKRARRVLNKMMKLTSTQQSATMSQASSGQDEKSLANAISRLVESLRELDKNKKLRHKAAKKKDQDLDKPAKTIQERLDSLHEELHGKMSETKITKSRKGSKTKPSEVLTDAQDEVVQKKKKTRRHQRHQRKKKPLKILPTDEGSDNDVTAAIAAPSLKNRVQKPAPFGQEEDADNISIGSARSIRFSNNVFSSGARRKHNRRFSHRSSKRRSNGSLLLARPRRSSDYDTLSISTGMLRDSLPQNIPVGRISSVKNDQIITVDGRRMLKVTDVESEFRKERQYLEDTTSTGSRDRNTSFVPDSDSDSSDEEQGVDGVKETKSEKVQMSEAKGVKQVARRKATDRAQLKATASESSKQFRKRKRQYKTGLDVASILAARSTERQVFLNRLTQSSEDKKLLYDRCRRLLKLLKIMQVPTQPDDLEIMYDYAKTPDKYKSTLMLICGKYAELEEDFPIREQKVLDNLFEDLMRKLHMARRQKLFDLEPEKVDSRRSSVAATRSSSFIANPIARIWDVGDVEEIEAKWHKFFEEKEKTAFELHLEALRQRQLAKFYKTAQPEEMLLTEKRAHALKLRPLTALYTDPRQTHRMLKVIEQMKNEDKSIKETNQIDDIQIKSLDPKETTAIYEDSNKIDNNQIVLKNSLSLSEQPVIYI